MGVWVRNIMLLVVLSSLAVGCGPPAKTVVKGTVTLDGTAVEEGLIQFVPEDGTTSPVSGPITKGSFSVEVPPGAKIVKINASKVIRKEKAYDTPDSPMKEIRAEIIPEKYNAKSEEKLEVKPGMDDKKYDLKSK